MKNTQPQAIKAIVTAHPSWFITAQELMAKKTVTNVDQATLARVMSLKAKPVSKAPVAPLNGNKPFSIWR